MKKLFIGALVLATALFIHTPNVSAQDVNNEYKQALQEMLEASNAMEGIRMFVPQLIKQLKMSLSDMPAEFWEEQEKKMQTEFMNRAIDGYVKLYQKHLTEDELIQITTFYRTPTGKKLANTMSDIALDCSKLWYEIGTQLSQELVKKYQDYKQIPQE